MLSLGMSTFEFSKISSSTLTDEQLIDDPGTTSDAEHGAEQEGFAKDVTVLSPHTKKFAKSVSAYCCKLHSLKSSYHFILLKVL